MSIRIASLSKRISANGQALHRAMMTRIEAHGSDGEPSEAELDLIEGRRLLKEERSRRHAQAMQPGVKAADRLVRTHHALAKDKPKTRNEAQDGKETRAAKPHKSRAEKHAAKAAALDAARRSPKKPSK
jgi:hypothetical protein